MKRTTTAIFALLALGTSLAASMQEQYRVEQLDFDAALPRDGARTDTTLYEESFSLGLGDWSGVDLTNAGSTWHPDDWNSFDGSNAWWSADPNVGGYVDHSLLYLELPAINLSATAAPLLTFDLAFGLEGPAGAPAPYDGWDACHVEVRMGTGVWQVIAPESPAYTVDNAFGFGEIFGLDQTAGWAGQSGGWQAASFDLSDYRSTATRIRFALCSDDGFSAADDPSLFGMQVDNILIVDGGDTLLENNADGLDNPGPTLHYSGVPSAGNNWAATDDAYSAPGAAVCSVLDQDVPINNALVSSPVFLPENYNLFVDFWTRVDLQDFDGDGDTSLEDYFLLEISQDGSTWHQLFYDYYDTETGLGNWYHFVDGGGHGRSTDVTEWGGSVCFFRFRVKTDDNHDGGTGEGLFIDDFKVVGEPQLAADAGIVELRIPYPRTVGRPINCSVGVQNFGSTALTGVEWGLWLDEADTGIGGSLDLGVGQLAAGEFVLTPAAQSFHFPEARLLGEDDYSSNNELAIPSYVVRPAGVLELANDYAWDVTNSEFEHTTGYGEEIGIGYTQAFTVPGLSDNTGFALDSLRLRFASYNVAPTTSADWTLELRLDDPVDGTLIYTEDYIYNPTYSGGEASEDWQEINLTAAGIDLFSENVEFWVTVFARSQGNYQNAGAPVPNPTIVSRGWEDAASYRIIPGDESLIPIATHQFNYHVFGHEEVLDSVADALSRPERHRLSAAWPNPFNPSTQLEFTLIATGDVELKLYDMLGREAQSLRLGRFAAGTHQQELRADGLPSGIYLLDLSVDGISQDRMKLMLMK